MEGSGEKRQGRERAQATVMGVLCGETELVLVRISWRVSIGHS